MNEKMRLFNLSMLVLRLILGSILIVYGAQKLFGMFGGIGLEGTAKMVEGFGVSPAYIVASVWSTIEFVGGICILLGILSRWAAIIVTLTMAMYLIKVDLAYGFVFQKTGAESTLLLIAACVPLVLMGGGSWSVWDV